ncbi:hypothetical protein IKN40_07530 [bacterium]|nr:hypothetical protein [bacterium]
MSVEETVTLLDVELSIVAVKSQSLPAVVTETLVGVTTNLLTSRALSSLFVISPASTIISSVLPAANLTSSEGQTFLTLIAFLAILTSATFIVPAICEAGVNCVSSPLV